MNSSSPTSRTKPWIEPLRNPRARLEPHSPSNRLPENLNRRRLRFLKPGRGQLRCPSLPIQRSKTQLSPNRMQPEVPLRSPNILEDLCLQRLGRRPLDLPAQAKQKLQFQRRLFV